MTRHTCSGSAYFNTKSFCTISAGGFGFTLWKSCAALDNAASINKNSDSFHRQSPFSSNSQ